MNAKDCLTRLRAIQELALEIRKATDEIENAPARIEEIEDRFRERNAEYVALKDSLEDLETLNAKLKRIERFWSDQFHFRG